MIGESVLVVLGLIHKGMNDGGFGRLKVLADRRLFDVQRIRDNTLRAASGSVVVAKFNRLIEYGSLFVREQFQELGVVQGLGAEFHFVAVTEEARQTLAS